MSRAGYCDDLDNWSLIKYRGRVASAIRGKRGQAFLRELLLALDAMPVKELISGELEEAGQFCALGVVGQARGINLADLDTYDHESLSHTFNIAEVLSREIMYMNDEYIGDWEWVWDGVGSKRVRRQNAAAKRWKYVRDWVESSITGHEIKGVPV